MATNPQNSIAVYAARAEARPPHRTAHSFLWWEDLERFDDRIQCVSVGRVDHAQVAFNHMAEHPILAQQFPDGPDYDSVHWRPTMSAWVHADELWTIQLGADWGLAVSPTQWSWHPTLHDKARQELKKRGITKELYPATHLDRSDQPGVPTSPVGWKWTNEKGMAAKLRVLAKQAILDRAKLIYRYWATKQAPSALWPSIATSVLPGDANEQERQNVQNYVDRIGPTDKANFNKASLAVLNLQRELDVRFDDDIVTDFASFETAAANYVSGKFGIDWFLRDFHTERWNTYMFLKAEAYHRGHARSLELRYGLSECSTAFGDDQLKPLWKRHRELARLSAG